mmetsp:Transcript_45496/g.115679  ORF Transcript_45496/g.115679 Transcript_45496/m.115679 type:complete len:137 (-) Transcript_45496:271-681(-)
MMSSVKTTQPAQQYRRPLNHKRHSQNQKQQLKDNGETTSKATRTGLTLTGDVDLEGTKANYKELLRSPAGSISSSCSTAVPPTPLGERLADLRRDSSTWQEDDDDDEILEGYPLWNYSGPLLDEVLKAMDNMVPAQ